MDSAQKEFHIGLSAKKIVTASCLSRWQFLVRVIEQKTPKTLSHRDRKDYRFSLTKMLRGRFLPKESVRESSPEVISLNWPRKASRTTVSPRAAL